MVLLQEERFLFELLLNWRILLSGPQSPLKVGNVVRSAATSFSSEHPFSVGGRRRELRPATDWHPLLERRRNKR